MRRKDKEITNKTEIETIIKKAPVCRIAICDNGIPYVVPVCFGYDGNRLYFHSAHEGWKIDILKRNNNVCFEMDIDHNLVKSGNPCSWSMEYSSVIGSGKAFFVEDPEEKRKALGIIVEHYSGKSYGFSDEAVSDVTVIKIEIEKISGKKSRV